MPTDATEPTVPADTPVPAEPPTSKSVPGCRKQAVRSIALIVALVIGFRVLGSIYDVATSRSPRATAEPGITATCSNAFATAAAVNPYQDTVSDLDEAVLRCQSVKDWIAGNNAHRAIDGDPVEFLLNRCRPGQGAPQHGMACIDVGKLYPNFLYETPYAELTPGP